MYIRVYVDSRENDQIVRLAQQKNLSPSDYIRSFLPASVLSDTAFRRTVEKTLSLANEVPIGVEFSVKMLHGINWATVKSEIGKNSLAILGRTFYKEGVEKQRVNGLKSLGDRGGSVMYIRENQEKNDN